ncbi:MAG: vitamin B12 dependent methionine synthase [Acutalibacteraceae bacterium]
MNQKIVLEQPAVREKELFRLLHMDENDEDNAPAIRRMLAEASQVAVPKAIYRVVPVTEKGEDYVVAGGVRLHSALVRRNLEQVSRIVPYVLSCGTELEEWSRTYDDPLDGYIADTVKLLYLGAIRRELHQAIKDAYFQKNDMSSMNPGSVVDGWPLTAQRDLFAMLGGEDAVQEEIGVQLTESCLMLPSKAGSGFFFSAESHYENCRFCPLLTCPNRREAFCGHTAAAG